MNPTSAAAADKEDKVILVILLINFSVNYHILVRIGSL